MRKPEFSKPFNLEHAKAGAPISTAGRGGAKFLVHAEEAARHCCVVVVEQAGNIGTRYSSGRVNEADATDNPFDLVMLPLGMIDGKPVFVGDEIIDLYGSKVEARASRRDFAHCTWPAPAKVYPVTQMTCEKAKNVYYSQNESQGNALIFFANAALRHAIDAGQVVTAEDHQELQGKLLDSQNARLLLNEAREARDMAVAAEVQAACFHMNARDLDLVDIICGVRA